MKAQRLPEPALRTASWDAEPGDRTGAELATTDRVLMKPRRHPAQWLAEALPNAHVQQRPRAEAGKTQVSATSRPPHVAVRSSLANVTPGSQASPAREHKRGHISVTRVPPAWKAAVLCPSAGPQSEGGSASPLPLGSWTTPRALVSRLPEVRAADSSACTFCRHSASPLLLPSK